MDENKSIATAEIPDNASCEQNRNENAPDTGIPTTDVPATEANETEVGAVEAGEITPEEAEALETNEEEPTIKKKSKKKAVAIVMTCIFLIGLIGGGLFGGYTVINKRGQQLLVDMTENADAEALSNEYRKLGALGQKFFHQAIVEKFVEQIKNNPYKAPYASGKLRMVSVNSINKYKTYKAIAETLEITEEDTNAIDYIEKVLVLEKYIPYNEFIGCYVASLESVESALDLLKSTFDVLPYYGYVSTANNMVDYAIELAEKQLDKAISQCTKYYTADELCKSYIDELRTFKSACDSAYKLLYRKDEIAEITNNISELAKTVTEKGKASFADTEKIPDISTITVNQKEG